MRFNNIAYLLKEGIRGIFTHGFMSFAAVCVTVACLVIVGSFSLLTYNVSIMVEELNQTNEILVYVDETLADADARSISISTTSCINGNNRFTSDIRLPGTSVIIFSSFLFFIIFRPIKPSAIGCPTATVSKPYFVKYGNSKSKNAYSLSNIRAYFFARFGRHAHTWGATTCSNRKPFAINSRPASDLRIFFITLLINPGASIETTTSGFSEIIASTV